MVLLMCKVVSLLCGVQMIIDTLVLYGIWHNTTKDMKYHIISHDVFVKNVMMPVGAIQMPLEVKLLHILCCHVDTMSWVLDNSTAHKWCPYPYSFLKCNNCIAEICLSSIFFPGVTIVPYKLYHSPMVIALTDLYFWERSCGNPLYWKEICKKSGGKIPFFMSQHIHYGIIYA